MDKNKGDRLVSGIKQYNRNTKINVCVVINESRKVIK